MAHGGEQMGSGTVVVDGVAQGLAVERDCLVVAGVILVPARQGVVEIFGDDPDQELADGVGGGRLEDAVSASASEALAGRLAQVLCPLADRLVAAHAAQGCGAGDGEDGLDRVALSILFPGIGDALEVGGQGPHLVCSDHASGTSMMVGLCQPGCAEARPGIGDKRFDEDELGCDLFGGVAAQAAGG